MRLGLVFGVVGQLLRYFSAAFLAPILLALVERDLETARNFFVGLAATFIVGGLIARRPSSELRFQRSEALAVVSFTWLCTALCVAIPYAFEGLSAVDALFEAMSGLTTTGATILPSFAGHSDAFFLWRALTQWFGGVGVIALFVVVLPRLGIAGRQLFFAEASTAPTEAISPRLHDAATRLWVLYLLLTLVLAVSLKLAGMSVLDALLHALTTMSAGGFSPNAQSIAGYGSPLIEWLLVPFMLIAGTSFTLLYKIVVRRSPHSLRDEELLFYLGAAILASVGIACLLADGAPDLETLRHAAFQVASLISSTGFASTDYNLWGDGPRAVLILVMVLGGCAGSAAGGPKAIRWVMVLKRVGADVRNVLHPRAVLPLKYDKHPVPEPIARAVFALVVLYMAAIFIGGLLLVLLGSDLVTGFSAALACVNNVGPAFGSAGPMGSFAAFSDPAKLLLTFCMWIGRLEIVTVLALLHPDVWRHLRAS